MALLTFPHFPSNFPSLSRFPNTRRFIPSRRRCSTGGTAILWFKHDLRTDDHPGLLAASNFKSLVPIYVFDHRILSRFSDEMLELVLFALQDLRKSLQNRGSDLMIKFGNAETVIQQLATEVEATCVFAEQEVEYELRLIMDVVNQSLKSVVVPQGTPKIELWNTPFYDVKVLQNIPASYDDFKKLRLPVTTPLQLSTLPGTEMELDWGSLPMYDDIKEFVTKNLWKSGNDWNLIKEKSAETLLYREMLKTSESEEKSYSFRKLRSRETKEPVFVTKQGNVVGGGTNNVLNALAAYLRYLEGTARDDWQEVHEKVQASETRNGASFTALFGPSLSLGIISRRRVHYEAIKYEKERNAGFLSPFGYSAATIAAAVDAVCSKEWYWLMALRNQINNDEIHSTRIWRWNGFLIQYTVAGEEGPAVLLVHGFGAFGEHYRDNIVGLAGGGNRVWAITLLGFGKSEKPNIVYTELLWAELLRDFIVDVVGEPVHLAGNSIGVLGMLSQEIHPYHCLDQLIDKRQGLPGVERADDWLINEMLRASYDPGVPVVLESIFSFNLSIPLNYLLEDVKEKVLIIQGMKDPISNSNVTVAMLKERCDGVIIKELDAGHCPHDEVPESVNTIICDWIHRVESRILAGYPV